MVLLVLLLVAGAPSAYLTQNRNLMDVDIEPTPLSAPKIAWRRQLFFSPFRRRIILNFYFKFKKKFEFNSSEIAKIKKNNSGRTIDRIGLDSKDVK